ncbi:MAG TPA: DUF2520 domain-containing protein [Candidatus Angelobacter sp.]|nr:DUF2520 domain-containing protein [Candidatus Angelobacter sp.]
MLKSLAIVGAGRVGRALGRRLREEGWKIGAIVTRSEGSAQRAARFIGAGKPCVGMTRQILAAPLVLIAVPDDEIAGVDRELARIGGEELQGKVVLHTSGALDSRVLSATKQSGASVGSMHPLQTFTGKNVPSLEGKIIAVEGDVRAVRVARQMARSLGGSPALIPGEKKVLYHAAAAMAAGHVLAVEESATQLLVSLGMGRREAVHALLSLTRQVLENFEQFGPHAAWTGPLSRSDYHTVAAHLQSLRDSSEEFSSAYQALNQLAARVLAQDPAGMLTELEKISSEIKPKAKGKGNNA